MKILIVAATEFEIAKSIPTLKEYQVDYLITGVGMTATAFALGSRLAVESYDLLLNVGIAGTFDTSQRLGTLVSVIQDSIFELGAEDQEEFIPIEKLGFGQSSFQEKLPEKTLKSSYTRLLRVPGITVNKVHGNKNTIELLRTSFAPHTIETMEGAAFFYAASQVNTPAIQVRALSNYVESRNTENWEISKAVEELNAWLIEFMKEHQS